MTVARLLPFCVLGLLVSLPGCGGGSAGSGKGSQGTNGPKTAEAPPKPKKQFKPVTIGESGPAGEAPASGPKLSGEARSASIVEALQPLQVLLGKWRGTTSKKFKGFNNVEELEWVWDFKTNRAQPALVMSSDKSPYVQAARVTYLPDTQKFQMKITSPEGEERTLEGEWEEAPADVSEGNEKPQRTYKLNLTQTAPEDDAEQWAVVLNQRENNRYLMELSRKRGSAEFARLDTIGTQRLGTSFAINDEDYGENKCIISGGLGVMNVTYKGKSYPVCCTGCAAAFNDDPELWLAKLADKEKMKKE